MPKLIIFLFVGGFPYFVLAQDSLSTINKRKSVTALLGYSNDFSQRKHVVTFTGFSYGFLNKKNNQHEFLLKKYDFDRHVLKGKRSSGLLYDSLWGSTLTLVLGYQYTKSFTNWSTNKLQPQMGILWQSAIWYSTREGANLNQWRRKRVMGIYSLHISPQVQYNINHSFKLTLAIPIRLLWLDTIYQRVYNPNLSKQNQRTGSALSHFELNDSLKSSLGMGIKF